MNDAKLLDESQTAHYLNMSASFLRKARLKRTSPPYIKIGRVVRYRMSDLQEFVENRIVMPSNESNKRQPKKVLLINPKQNDL